MAVIAVVWAGVMVGTPSRPGAAAAGAPPPPWAKTKLGLIMSVIAANAGSVSRESFDFFILVFTLILQKMAVDGRFVVPRTYAQAGW